MTAAVAKSTCWGKPLHAMDEEARAQLRAQNVGFVFQSFMLIPTPQRPRKTSSYRPCCAAKTAVKAAPVPKHYLMSWGWANVLITFRRSFPAASSSVWRWRAPLMADRRCCLPMNPLATLDRQTGDKIADLLFSMNQQFGTTLLLVTHDLQLAARCDRRLRLVNGELREEA